jgi:predicted transcriptional regulator
VKAIFEIKEIPSDKLNADSKEKKRSELKNENVTIYEILEHLVSEEKGYISDIMSLYKPELIVELCTSDYISINTEEDNKDTWSITETGKKCYKLYKELTDKEQERGKLLHDLSV